jgi:hypothetical protein
MYNLVSSLHLALPLIVLGFVLSGLRRQVIAVIVLCLLPIPLWNQFVQPSFTDSYLITLYPWLGLLGGGGLWWLVQPIRRRPLRTALLLVFVGAHAWLSFSWWVRPLRERSDALKSFVMAWDREQPPTTRVLADWETALRYNYYTSGELRTGACSYYRRVDTDSLAASLARGEPVFLLEERPIRTPLKNALAWWIPEADRTRIPRIELDRAFDVQLVRDGTFPVYRVR